MKRLFAAFAVFLALVTLGPRTGEAGAQGALTWVACGQGFECATLSVPVDYARPGGPSLDLALSRLPAANRSQRLGSLVVNPGGPGASGVEFVRAWARSLEPAVRDRFDIVGFDPRGVGASTPIVCHSNLQKYVAADPTPDSQDEWDVLRAVSKVMAGECSRKHAEFLPHLGTKDVARDLDRIRAALGDEKLTYLGYSYGTSIGQVYADMFPANVRAMVLDGAVDNSLPSEERSRTQAAGFERALQNFIDDCREADCPLARRGDPAQAVEDLFAKAEAAPIPAPARDRPAGPGEVMLGVIQALYSQQLWPVLANAINAGLNGDGSLLVTLTDAYLQRSPGGAYPNIIESNTAVNCIDGTPTTLPVRYEDYGEAAARFAEVSPHFGPAFATGLACLDWAAGPDPLGVPTAAGAPPILVVSTTADPATPYEWGVALSRQLESGVLLTYRGEGHTAYGGNDDCVDSTVNAYLVTLTLPAGGAVCGNGPGPGEVPSPARSPQGGGPPRAGGDVRGPDTGTAVLRSLAVIAAALLALAAVAVVLRPGRD